MLVVAQVHSQGAETQNKGSAKHFGYKLANGIKIFIRTSRTMKGGLPGCDLRFLAAILDFKMAAIQNRFSTLSQVLDKIEA